MKFDLQLLYAFLIIGLISKRLSGRGWFFVCMLIAAWMAFNIVKG